MTKQLTEYHFTSHWKINAPITAAELAIYNIDEWHKWWPDLVAAEVVHQSSTYKGSIFRAAWRSMAGYVLRMEITITSHLPGRQIVFTAEGDLSGSGRWEFRPSDENTSKMQIDWDVQTTKPWMNRFSPVLRPFFRYNHRLVMKRAERGLNNYLQQDIVP